MITVAETESFQKKANQLLSERGKSDLVAYLSSNPQSGVLIRIQEVFGSSGGLEVVAGKVVG